MNTRTDLIIVGAGIVGLAHAYEAQRRGLTVRVIERDWAPNGASIRNFGHACITTQTGDLLDMAYRSREGWLAAAQDAGSWARDVGAMLVARTEAELTVIEQLHAERGDALQVLSAQQVRERFGTAVDPDPRIIGGGFMRDDLRVDPRTAAPTLGLWLEKQERVTINWGTSVGGFSGNTVSTSRGDFEADKIIVCVGHDLDYLFPELTEKYEVKRCALQMAMAPAPRGYELDQSVMSGTSINRYEAFTLMPGHAALFAELNDNNPDLMEMGANVMFTRRPDGTLLLGDSHSYELTMPPFLEDQITDRLVSEISTIIGRPLEVTQRWQGVYASSSKTPLLIEDVTPAVRCLSVTSGIGMTLCFGLAAATLDSL
ncbi:TIGR03364 family FAD-dependent oxidoreductase [Leucobacter sp. cx-42]|uniref:TIGR03364 family FAD-dependent oxidoreductase n=1 Tax=unclassified Leucobacter TaxID=2621730 RepID=UPI00165E8CDF|nr:MULTISPECIES: TIGR03364 family FAD-dependent oxidoreductase [unclassified Leucobacter]MBC9953744.1 TIGR03364 family FAD-dependent oxidoreductase [Leucobacter sp. cx-42]